MNISKEAEKLLGELALKFMPIDLEAVAKKLGINLVFDNLEDDISGFIKSEDNEAICVINKRQHANRQRFTIAHEIGHFILHCQGKDGFYIDKGFQFRRDGNSATGVYDKEIEANNYAAGLLMPEELVKEEFQKISNEFDSYVHIPLLAKKFKVSKQAMTFRLINLKLISDVFE